MKIAIEYDDGHTREYILDERTTKEVHDGAILHITARHPNYSEMFKVGTTEALKTLKLNELTYAIHGSQEKSNG